MSSGKWWPERAHLPEHQKMMLEMFEAELVHFINPFAITLTFKSGLRLYRKDGVGRVYTGEYVRIDRDQAAKTLRRFRSRLARKCLTRSAIRDGQQVPMIAVLEQSADGRPHYHLAADMPGLDLAATKQLISDLWEREPFAYREIDVQSVYGDGWLGYMLKSVCPTADRFFFGIDWENSSILEAQRAA